MGTSHKELQETLDALRNRQEELQSRVKRTEIIADLGQRALAQVDLFDLMQEAARLTAVALAADFCNIMELIPEKKLLVLRAGMGWEDRSIGNAVNGTGADSQPGYTLLLQEPVALGDVENETGFGIPSYLKDHGISSGISTVIHGHEQPFGVLGAYTRKEREFSQEDIHFLQTIANTLATAIQRKKSEEISRRLAAIVESSDDAILSKAPDGIILSWNPGAEKMYGYSAEEMVGRSISDLIPPENREELNMILERLRNGLPLDQYETTRIRKDGKRIAVSLTISPIRGRKGKIAGASSIAKEITKQKQAEERLRDSREQLRALSAHLQSVREEERTRIAREIHDELGQVMTALRIDLSLLTTKLTKSSAVISRPVLLKEITSVSNLIDSSIQTIRRIATELRPEVLDHLGLKAAIEWQAQEFQNRTGIDCEIFSELDTEIENIESSIAIFRILQEALTNIVKHAEASAVQIRIGEKDSYFWMDVIDDGKGIPDEELSQKVSFGLLGIRERAALLGGEVTITGAAGKGTTVSLRVPLTSLRTPETGEMEHDTNPDS